MDAAVLKNEQQGVRPGGVTGQDLWSRVPSALKAHRLFGQQLGDGVLIEGRVVKAPWGLAVPVGVPLVVQGRVKPVQIQGEEGQVVGV
jgi:hypothetical protein